MSLGGALGNGGGLTSAIGKGGSTLTVASIALVIPLLTGGGEVTISLLAAGTGGQLSTE